MPTIPHMLEILEASLKTQRINPAEYVIAVSLLDITEQLNHFNQQLKAIVDLASKLHDSPPEPIALSIKKGQVKK